MKMLITILLALFTFLSFQHVVYAAESKVTWTEYKKYRDIRSGNESRKHFRERTFKNFEKHFTKLAGNLNEGQILKVDVIDVDLAGDTLAGGIDRIRIVKEIYSPRINFSYQLTNADGSEVVSDEIVLRDMNFMQSSRLKYRNDSLGYEKKMLDDWFFEAFKGHIIEKE